MAKGHGTNLARNHASFAGQVVRILVVAETDFQHKCQQMPTLRRTPRRSGRGSASFRRTWEPRVSKTHPRGKFSSAAVTIRHPATDFPRSRARPFFGEAVIERYFVTPPSPGERVGALGRRERFFARKGPPSPASRRETTSPHRERLLAGADEWARTIPFRRVCIRLVTFGDFDHDLPNFTGAGPRARCRTRRVERVPGRQRRHNITPKSWN